MKQQALSIMLMLRNNQNKKSIGRERKSRKVIGLKRKHSELETLLSQKRM